MDRIIPTHRKEATMKKVSTSRTYKSQNVGIYFAYLSDADIQKLIDACEEELELRSQEEIRVGDEQPAPEPKSDKE